MSFICYSVNFSFSDLGTMLNCQVARTPSEKEYARLDVQSDQVGDRTLCVTMFPGTKVERIAFLDISAVVITRVRGKDQHPRDFDVAVLLRRKVLSTDLVLVGKIMPAILTEWHDAFHGDSSHWIIYDYTNVEEADILDPSTTVGKHTIWKVDHSPTWHKQRATLPLFPHSKHDILGLSKNDSVVRRLSRGGDFRVELTSEGVSISGILAGQSQPCEPDHDTIDTFRATCSFDCVLIVGNKHIYATSQNGSVLGKLKFADFTPTYFSDNRGSTVILRSHDGKTCACISCKQIDEVMSIISRNSSTAANARSPQNITRRSVSPAVSVVVPNSSERSERNELSFSLQNNPRDASAILTLGARVEELEGEIREKDALIRLLQERLMSSTVDGTRNLKLKYDRTLSSTVSRSTKRPEAPHAVAASAVSARQDELEFLQQHLDCLRKYCLSLEDKLSWFDCRSQLDFNWVSSNGEAALRQALLESHFREQAAKRRIETLTQDLDAVKKATDDALQIMSNKIDKTVEDLYETKIVVEPLLTVEGIQQMLKTQETRAEEQTKKNTHLLRQQISFLAKELRERDHLLEKSLSCDWGNIAETTRKITSLHQERTTLEGQVCSLERQIQDLEETVELVRSSLAASLESKRSPLQTELISMLELKVASLSKLQHVPQFISRNSALQRSLENHEFAATKTSNQSSWVVGRVDLVE